MLQARGTNTRVCRHIRRSTNVHPGALWLMIALGCAVETRVDAQIAPCYREVAVTPCGTMPPETGACGSCEDPFLCDARSRIVHTQMHDVAAGQVSADYSCETTFCFYVWPCYWDWDLDFCMTSPASGQGGQYYTCRIDPRQLCDEENEW